jgi:hypothetical protein
LKPEIEAARQAEADRTVFSPSAAVMLAELAILPAIVLLAIGALLVWAFRGFMLRPAK